MLCASELHRLEVSFSFFVPLSSPLSVFIILSRLFCSPPGTVVWFKESTQTIFDLDSSIVSPVPLVIMLLLINKSWQGLGLHKWELFFRGKDLLYFLPYFLINISSVLSSWYILTIGIQTIDKLTYWRINRKRTVCKELDTLMCAVVVCHDAKMAIVVKTSEIK